MGMQEIKELVPKLEQLKELYQLEEFKVLREFLLNSKLQLESTLLGVDWKSEKVTVVGGMLTAQINLIGAILELPNIVKRLSDQFEKNESLKNQQKELVEDPLAKEGF
jgi:hypothetical protein